MTSRIGLVVHGGKPAAIAAADRVRQWAADRSIPCVDIDVWDGSDSVSRHASFAGQIPCCRGRGLALTGKGHGTDKALMLGLEGATPEGIDPDEVEPRIAAIRVARQLQLLNVPRIPWDESKHLLFLRKETLPQHPNGMRFVARNTQGPTLLE